MHDFYADTKSIPTKPISIVSSGNEKTVIRHEKHIGVK